jgi:hypothetical protein
MTRQPERHEFESPLRIASTGRSSATQAGKRNRLTTFNDLLTSKSDSLWLFYYSDHLLDRWESRIIRNLVRMPSVVQFVNHH